MHPTQELRQRSSTVAGSGEFEVEHQAVSASPNDHKKATAPRPASSQSWIERALAWGGRAFEVLTVTINIADVISDVVVAVQFYRNDDMVWFWLVVSFLALAHLVYTGIAYAILVDQPNWAHVGWNNIPGPLRLFMSFLLAQFVPLLNLIFQHDYVRHAPPSSEEVYPPEDDLELDIDRGTLSKAGLEELRRIHESRLVYVRMRKALDDHMATFGLFYVESAVEAAPQAIIQLLAITFLGRASWVQLVSLCCSLFSITSKGFIISRAYDLRVMMFKFACAAQDVFSTFYLFSTLVATTTPKHTSFFGLEVSWLGYIWLWKGCIFLAYGILSGFVMTIVAFKQAHSSYERKNLLRAFGIATFISVPIFLVIEALKATWLNFFLTMGEPGTHFSPHFGLILSFLDNDDVKSSRLRHLFVSMGNARATELYDAEGFIPPRSQLLVRRASTDTTRFTVWQIAKESTIDQLPKFAQMRTEWRNMRWDQRAGFSWLGLTCVLLFVGQMFSLLYPLLNFFLVGGEHDMLQATCLTAMSLALTVCVALGPRAALFAAVNQGFREILPAVSPSLRALTGWIEEYHQPTHIGVVQTLVPVAVMPHAVTKLVALYLTAADVGVDNLSVAECAALKRELSGTYGIETERQRAEPERRPHDLLQAPDPSAALDDVAALDAIARGVAELHLQAAQFNCER